MAHPRGIPSHGVNLYTDAAILDPYPHYRRLRETGPVVWLPAHRVYALPRYVECRAALLDDATFRSASAVALNPISNRMSRRTTLSSDGAENDRRRKLLAHRMLPRVIAALGDQVQRAANDLVGAAVHRGDVDGVDLAASLPLSVVPDLVGWPADQREHLIDWAGATFDVLGPFNRRMVGSSARALQMLRFARQVERRRSVLPGSMADELLTAVDDGVITRRDCRALLVDYLGPAIDTTMSDIATALSVFASHPDQWELLRSEPGRIPNAINEIVRYESAVRAFARKVTSDSEIGGTFIPAGSRVLVMYASANRDEREWEHPDVFDITRDAGRHLGFGKGVHACAGQALARLEITAFLTPLIEHAERVELTETPKWALNTSFVATSVCRCASPRPSAKRRECWRCRVDRTGSLSLIAVTSPWTAGRLGNLTGKRVVVTGATNGVGLGTTRALVRAGAHVILAVRDTTLGMRRAAEVGGLTSVVELDLADMASVRAFPGLIDGDVDILINNAGTLTEHRSETVDGFETTLGTNMLGPFALTNLLLPRVRSLIVNVGSEVHRSATLRLDDMHLRNHRWTSMGAYAQSKLAVMLWGLELDRRLRDARSPVVAQLTHPGWVASNLSHVSDTPLMSLAHRAVKTLADRFANDIDEGAAPTLYCISEPIPPGSYVGVSGRFGLRGGPVLIGRSVLACDYGAAARLVAFAETATGTTLSV